MTRECPQCDGTGDFTCRHCSGNGSQFPEQPHSSICIICGGSGKAICERCDGEGVIYVGMADDHRVIDCLSDRVQQGLKSCRL
jgi:DnaJ-class molecular chaperone